MRSCKLVNSRKGSQRVKTVITEFLLKNVAQRYWMLVKLKGIIKYECVIVKCNIRIIFSNLGDNKALQISGFRHSQKHRMICGLTPSLNHPERPVKVVGGFR